MPLCNHVAIGICRQCLILKVPSVVERTETSAKQEPERKNATRPPVKRDYDAILAKIKKAREWADKCALEVDAAEARFKEAMKVHMQAEDDLARAQQEWHRIPREEE